MQSTSDDPLQAFHHACSELCGGSVHVVEANNWLLSLQNSESCGTVCLQVLSQSGDDGSGSSDPIGKCFIASKLLHTSLRRHRQYSQQTKQHQDPTFWNSARDIVTRALVFWETNMPVNRQLCRCLCVVVIMEYSYRCSIGAREGGRGDSGLSFSTPASFSSSSASLSAFSGQTFSLCDSDSDSTITQLTNAATKSMEMLKCLVYVLEELPSECVQVEDVDTHVNLDIRLDFHSDVDEDEDAMVEMIVSDCAELVLHAVLFFYEHAEMEGLASALQCLLLWTRAKYLPTQSKVLHVQQNGDGEKIGLSMSQDADQDLSIDSNDLRVLPMYNYNIDLDGTRTRTYRSWISLDDMLTQRGEEGKQRSVFIDLLKIIEYLREQLSSNSLNDIMNNVFACLLEIAGELTAEPVSVPLLSAAPSQWSVSHDRAIAVLFMYITLVNIWETWLGVDISTWCAFMRTSGDDTLAASTIRAREAMIDNNVIAQLVEATVLIAERHMELLCAENEFCTIARAAVLDAVIGTGTSTCMPISDTDYNIGCVIGCLMAALALDDLPSAMLVMEVLNSPTFFKYQSKIAGMQESNHVIIGRSMLPQLLAVIRRQITLSLPAESFIQDSQQQQKMLLFEVGTKYRDEAMLNSIEDDEDILSQWLEYRGNAFELLQAWAASWPGGGNLFESVHGTVITSLQMLLTDLSEGTAEGEARALIHSRSTEALLFMWHSLLESAFTNNPYDDAQTSNGTDTGASARLMPSSKLSSAAVSSLGYSSSAASGLKSLRVLEMGIELVSSVTHLSTAASNIGLGFCDIALRHRCVKIWSLLPDVVGYALPKAATLSFASSSSSGGSHYVLELLCHSYQNFILSREASISALLAVTNIYSLKPVFEPHAINLCSWLEKCIQQAHQDAITNSTIFKSNSNNNNNCDRNRNRNRNGNAGYMTTAGHSSISFGAPVQLSVFTDKLYRIFGRAVCWLPDVAMVHKTTTSLLQAILENLCSCSEMLNIYASDVSVFATDASSACASDGGFGQKATSKSSIAHTLNLSGYFLHCIQGLVRGSGEGGSVETNIPYSEEDADEDDDGGNDDAQQIQSNADVSRSVLTLALPQLLDGLMDMMGALYCILWRDMQQQQQHSDTDNGLAKKGQGERQEQEYENNSSNDVSDLFVNVAQTTCKLLDSLVDKKDTASATATATALSPSVASTLLTRSASILSHVQDSLLVLVVRAAPFSAAQSTDTAASVLSAATSPKATLALFPAIRGILEVLIGAIRWIPSEEMPHLLHSTRLALNMSLNVCGKCHADLNILIADENARRQGQGQEHGHGQGANKRGNDVKENDNTNGDTEEEATAVSAVYSIQILLLCSCLRLMRQACTSWPALFQCVQGMEKAEHGYHDDDADDDNVVVSGNGSDSGCISGLELFSSVIDMFCLTMQMSLARYDAQLVRLLGLTCSSFFDVDMPHSPAPAVLGRPRLQVPFLFLLTHRSPSASTSASDRDKDVNVDGMHENIQMLLVYLLLGGLFLPPHTQVPSHTHTYKASRTFTAIVDKILPHVWAILLPAPISTLSVATVIATSAPVSYIQLIESICSKIVLQLIQGGRWPNDTLAARVQAVYDALASPLTESASVSACVSMDMDMTLAKGGRGRGRGRDRGRGRGRGFDEKSFSNRMFSTFDVFRAGP